MKWVITWPLIWKNSVCKYTVLFYTIPSCVWKKEGISGLSHDRSYHWRGFPAQLSPWQQEREVECSAMCGGRRGAGLPFLVTVGVWLSSGRLGYSAGPPASQEHKWSCVNSLFAGTISITTPTIQCHRYLSLSKSRLSLTLKSWQFWGSRPCGSK